MVLNALAGLAGALSLVAAPVATAVPPINVVSCVYTSQQVSSAVTGFARTAPFELSNLRISFVNQGPLEARDVRFAVSYDGLTQIVDDRGRFATAKQITRDFQPLATGTFRDDPARCAVQSVTFADGSTWQPS